MRAPAEFYATDVVPALQRPLVRVLLAALVFEAFLLAGVLFSPLFRFRVALPTGFGSSNPAAAIAGWRRSAHHHGNDPRLGVQAPLRSLCATTGRPVKQTDLIGRKVALVLTKDGAG